MFTYTITHKEKHVQYDTSVCIIKLVSTLYTCIVSTSLMNNSKHY